MFIIGMYPTLTCGVVILIQRKGCCSKATISVYYEFSVSEWMLRSWNHIRIIIPPIWMGFQKNLNINRVQRKLMFEVFLRLDDSNEEEYFRDWERLPLCFVLRSTRPLFGIFQPIFSLGWKPNLPVILTELLPPASTVTTTFTKLHCYKGLLRNMPNIFTSI